VITWFGFKSRAAVRLFESRFAAYWSARIAGLRHEDALAAVDKGATIRQVPSASRSEQEALELKALVWSMEESFAVVEVRARLSAIGSRA
jgi:hypothetical protein